MEKYPIYAILSGMLLVLASCVPVAGSLYRIAMPITPERFDLSVDGEVHRALQVTGIDHIMLALAFEFSPGELDAFRLRYGSTIRNGEHVQQRITGSIEPRGINRPLDYVDKGKPHRIERRLPVVVLADGQTSLDVDVEIDTDGNEQALLGAWGEIHRDPPRFALSFVNAVVVWTLGTLLVLIGAIQWGRQIAAVRADRIPDEETKQERIWCTLCHLSALAGYLLPFGHVLLPLLIWVTKRAKVRGVDDAGMESLNFQLTVSLFGLIGIMLSAVFIGLVLLFALVVLHVSMTLVACLRAQRGERVRYPVNIRIISAGL